MAVVGSSCQMGTGFLRSGSYGGRACSIGFLIIRVRNCVYPAGSGRHATKRGVVPTPVANNKAAVSSPNVPHYLSCAFAGHQSEQRPVSREQAAQEFEKRNGCAILVLICRCRNPAR